MGDREMTEAVSNMVCSRSAIHGRAVKEWDRYGSYLYCRVCGWTDNGLQGRKPYSKLPRRREGGEHLPNYSRKE